MVNSTVVDPKTGERVPSEVRPSFSMLMPMIVCFCEIAGLCNYCSPV